MFLIYQDIKYNKKSAKKVILIILSIIFIALSIKYFITINEHGKSTLNQIQTNATMNDIVINNINFDTENKEISFDITPNCNIYNLTI